MLWHLTTCLKVKPLLDGDEPQLALCHLLISVYHTTREKVWLGRDLQLIPCHGHLPPGCLVVLRHVQGGEPDPNSTFRCWHGLGNHRRLGMPSCAPLGLQGSTPGALPGTSSRDFGELLGWNNIHELEKE